jgi:hypothetical protein
LSLFFELVLQFRATALALVNGIGRDSYPNYVSMVIVVVIVVIIKVIHVVHDR